MSTKAPLRVADADVGRVVPTGALYTAPATLGLPVLTLLTVGMFFSS